MALPAAAIGDPVEQIRLSETQQQTGDGQHCDGQHQGAAQLLKSCKTKIHLASPPSCGEPLDHAAHLRGRTQGRDSSAPVRAIESMRNDRDLALERGHCRRHDRQFTNAEAQQDRYRRAIGGHAAANGHQLAGRPARARRGRNQLQHRRMQRIGAARQICVAAIHGERVLRQVIAADGQEIDLAQQAQPPSRRPPAFRSWRPANATRQVRARRKVHR